jgi:pimeloyl-ACP methyl ester carboxylesterase
VSAGAATTYPVNTDVVTAFATGLFVPSSPAGSNVPCTLTRAHPYPVILVHGTFENQNDNWQAMAPTLANAGYCVYSFNFGTANLGPTIGGVGEIGASAAQLAAEVATVQQKTGAKKVDLVGHSQGGMMPRYYLDVLGGAAHVSRFVALAPSNYGTTFNGILSLAGAVGLNPLVALGCESCVEQEQGSAFLTTLNAGGGVVPGPAYTVIESTKDEVVTPYTNAFLHGPNVTDITLQDLCPNDPVGHLGLPYDTTALQLTLNALDPATAGPVSCTTGFPL